jgi:SAM-dependent methyltransferase
LACGLGGNAGLFASSGYDGIDIEERYIAAARAADPTRRIHRMDARKLEFADGSFELVFAVGLFHHLSDDDARQVLLEIRRVTVAGGRVFVLDAIWPLRRWNVAGWLLRRLDRGKFVRTAREYAGLFGEVFAPVEVSVRSRFPLDFVVLDLRT